MDEMSTTKLVLCGGGEQMRITLEIPDTTVCAFFDFIRYTNSGMTMQGHSIPSDEMYDGAVILITAQETGDDE